MGRRVAAWEAGREAPNSVSAVVAAAVLSVPSQRIEPSPNYLNPRSIVTVNGASECDGLGSAPLSEKEKRAHTAFRDENSK